VKEPPSQNDPQADVVFIIEELLMLFNEASPDGSIELDDNCIELRSAVGGKFHARVLNAARHLGLMQG